jgi:hypothetical protein
MQAVKPRMSHLRHTYLEAPCLRATPASPSLRFYDLTQSKASFRSLQSTQPCRDQDVAVVSWREIVLEVIRLRVRTPARALPLAIDVVQDQQPATVCLQR